MKECWILFSKENQYYQPERAFEELYWHVPKHEDLEKYGFSEKESKALRKDNINGCGEYWVSKFKN